MSLSEVEWGRSSQQVMQLFLCQSLELEARITPPKTDSREISRQGGQQGRMTSSIDLSQKRMASSTSSYTTLRLPDGRTMNF